MFLWMLGLALGNALFVTEVPDVSGSPGGLLGLMLLAAALNTAVLMIFVHYAEWTGLRLAATVAMVLYFVQFFLSQIETLWFNDALGLPMNLIHAIFAGGLFTALLYAPVLVGIMGKLKPVSGPSSLELTGIPMRKLLIRISILVVLVYPVLYFTAGYFIAWQFEAVRIHYSGSAELKSFWEMLWLNLSNGLWVWQIARGLLWVLIAWPVLAAIRGGFPRSGIILGLLFAVLMNAQHLIPNPYMPGIIPLAHGIETASSNFIWGMAIAWLVGPLVTISKSG
jgi:hypothetical protein